MKYVEIKTHHGTSYAVCTADAAAHYNSATSADTIVTIADTPFLPQVKNDGLAQVKMWAVRNNPMRRAVHDPEFNAKYAAANKAIEAATTAEEVAAVVASLDA